jgi:hypothetical protein
MQAPFVDAGALNPNLRCHARRQHWAWKAEVVRCVLRGEARPFEVSCSPALDAALARLDVLSVRVEFCKIAAGRMKVALQDDKVRITQDNIRAFAHRTGESAHWAARLAPASCLETCVARALSCFGMLKAALGLARS